jgi:hypothetical protein
MALRRSVITLSRPRRSAAPGTEASRPRATFCPRRESLLRVVFAICVLCFALAIYSGHRIVSETHPTSYEPSPVPGVSRGPDRDSTATLEQAQRIRASRLAAVANRPSSTLGTIVDALTRR